MAENESMSSMKELEEYLDEKNEAIGGRKSPKHRGRVASSPKALDPLISGKYESKLQGWSPAHQHEQGKSFEAGMENLSLGPSASSTEEVKSKKKLKKEKKKHEKPVDAHPKKPKLTKKERRELQEAQRAAKAAGLKGNVGKGGNSAKSGNVGKGGNNENTAPTSRNSESSGVPLQYDDAKKLAKRSKQSVIHRTQAQKQMAVFSHLPQHERETSLSLNVGFSKNEIHPAVLTLGLKYAEGIITGANKRCIGMLEAFKEVIMDYKTPPNTALSRDLDKKLRPLIQFLIDCRPHSIPMGNAIRYVRNIIAMVPPDLPEDVAKQQLCEQIDTYIQERIVIAMEGIVGNAVSKIVDGDVILTYAKSGVMAKLLKRAKDQNRQFRVIVVDSRPHFEGRALVSELAAYGIKCTYVLINALGYIMREVTKVFLGAAAFMSNGVAYSRVGTATVAMTAKFYNIPVLFCCETYKFSDRVQLDSITQNELGDPDDLVTRIDDRVILSDWRDISALKLLNLKYDLTPIHYISMVVTEAGMTPPTSIPVLIREYRKDATI